MRRLALTCLSALVLAASACSLFTDLSGLEGQTDAADASPAADVAAPGVDGAGIAPEGGGSSRDADAGPYCASLAGDMSVVTCDDFDDGVLRGSPVVTVPSTTAIVDTSSVSPPRSLLARVRPPASGSCLNARMSTDIGVPANGMRLDYDVRLGRPDGTGFPKPGTNVALGGAAQLAGADGTGMCGYYLRLGPGTATMIAEPLDGAAQASRALSGAILPNTWTHVTMIIRGPSAAVTMTVQLDGRTVLEASPAPTACQSGRIREQSNGLLCVTTAPDLDIEMHIDNVVLRSAT